MNKLQVKLIEEKLTKVLQRINRIEDKEILTEKDQERLTENYGVLRGADEILTLLGYVRRYHEDTDGRGYYTLEKLGG